MELEILIKEKKFLLNKGLTVYIGDIGRDIYSQFVKKNIFGVNFSYGGYDRKNKLKIFVIDGQIFQKNQVFGYYGNCLNLKNDEKHEAFLMGTVFGGDKNDIILSFLLEKLVEHWGDVDLLIVNDLDGGLGAQDKLFLLKTLELFATKIPILFATKDVASLRISEIKFDMIDENNIVPEYFKMVEAIQNGTYNEYCQSFAQKNEKNKQRKSDKKVASSRRSNKKF